MIPSAEKRRCKKGFATVKTAPQTVPKPLPNRLQTDITNCIVHDKVRCL